MSQTHCINFLQGRFYQLFSPICKLTNQKLTWMNSKYIFISSSNDVHVAGIQFITVVGRQALTLRSHFCCLSLKLKFTSGAHRSGWSSKFHEQYIFFVTMVDSIACSSTGKIIPFKFSPTEKCCVAVAGTLQQSPSGGILCVSTLFQGFQKWWQQFRWLYWQSSRFVSEWQCP